MCYIKLPEEDQSTAYGVCLPPNNLKLKPHRLYESNPSECVLPGQWEMFDIGHEEVKEILLCFDSTGQRQRAREKQRKREKDSLSSHPHYVNEVHDCSVHPSRVNYQWLLSLIG